MPKQEPADALSLLAPFFRARPVLDVLCRLGDRWASPHGHESSGVAPFHMVTSGECLIELDGRPPERLVAGDVALLPHGDAHTTRNAAPGGGDAPRRPVRTRHNGAIAVRSNDGPGDRTPEVELICGRLAFDTGAAPIALRALPPLLLLRTASDPALAPAGAWITALKRELDEAQPGAASIAEHLASAVMVTAIRVAVGRGVLGRSLLLLLSRGQTARAIGAMLGDLSRPWRLDEVAGAAATSRATLVREFRRLAGAPPLAVLAELRMERAHGMLTNGDQPLAMIADAVGYGSESTFSRAVQRRFGMPPGELRASTRHRSGSAPPPRQRACPSEPVRDGP